MCLVCSWKTRLTTIWIAMVLLVWRRVGISWGIPSSPYRPWSQTISKHADDITQYSGQEIRESLRNMHQPVIERWVTRQPAESVSLKPINYKEVLVEKNNLWPEVPLR
jgi:hypothetical protein